MHNENGTQTHIQINKKKYEDRIYCMKRRQPGLCSKIVLNEIMKKRVKRKTTMNGMDEAYEIQLDAVIH